MKEKQQSDFKRGIFFMVVKGTYFQNDKDHRLVYGDINLINPPRTRLRGEEEK